MLQLSQKDRDRLVIVRRMVEKQMTVTRGAELLGLSRRQAHRILDRYRKVGDGAVIHRARGRPPNNAKAEEHRARVLKRAQEPVFRDFGPTLLAEHLSRDAKIGPLNSSTLRSWMIQDGLWKPKPERPRHRKARPRRAAFGELTQWDSSEHAWFEDRVPGRFTLIQMHDDATNRLLMARFVLQDDGAVNRQIAIDYLRRWGRPVAFYTDKAGHFGQWTRPVSPIPLEERDIKRTESIIRQALGELNVGLILAHSPQAKGRIERDFGTSQDRLVKELRVAGISTLAEGNRFLQDIYIPYWDEHFAVEPAEARDAHRPLPKKADLERIFAETHTRTVGHDFTIRFNNHRLQIPKSQARGIRPGLKLTVELRLDGSARYRIGNRYLLLEPVANVSSVPLRTPLPRPLPPHPPPLRSLGRHHPVRGLITHGARTAGSSPSPLSSPACTLRLPLRGRRF
jgi:hypothetical protein